MKELNQHIFHENLRLKIVPEFKWGSCDGCYFDRNETCPVEECEDDRRDDNTNVIFFLDPFKFGR